MLDFHEGKASPLCSISSSAAMQLEIECNILDLYTKIDSFELDLLDTKIVLNLGKLIK